MTYDAARQQVVLFGGEQCEQNWLRDTWTFNGVSWQQQHPAVSPPPGGLAAYDPDHGVVVLFTAPGIATGQTWTWDGATWTEQHPSTSPEERIFASLAYDPATHQVLLFGGKIQSVSGGLLVEQVTNELWAWNGSGWSRLD